MGKLKDHCPKTSVKLRGYSEYELAYVRESLRLTLEDVAEILMCSKQVLSDIEHGRSGVRSEKRKKNDADNGREGFIPARKTLYGIVLEKICEERGVTFDEVLSSTGYFDSRKE